MGSSWKEGKARVRHRGTSDGVTEVLIDRIDQEKKRKVLDYLRSINYQPLSEEEPPLVSVEVSSSDSERVCRRIVSFMRSLGVEEVSVSSVRFNQTRPAIEADSFTERDLTLADSEDIRRIADSMEKGEESEFELIVSSPVQSALDRGRWASKDVIKSLKQKRIASFREVQQSELKDNSTPGPIALLKPNWWARKKNIFRALLRRKRKKDKIVNRVEITQTNDSSFQKNYNTLSNILRNNQVNVTNPIKKNKEHFLENRQQEMFIAKNVQILEKRLATKIKLEAYTQTEENYKNFINSKHKTGNKIISDNMSSACCDCINSHYTETMIRPEVLNYPDVMNTNFPYYMNPIVRNPIFYVMPQDPFHQRRNYTVSYVGQGILEDRHNSFNNKTTSITSTTLVRKHKHQYKEKPFSLIKKQSGIKSNKSTHNSTWSTKLNSTKSDALYSDSQQTFTPSRATFTTCDANNKKLERIHNPYTNKNRIRIRNDFGDVPSNESVKEKKLLEKQLADIQNKLEKITNFQKETKEKVNTAVDCCDLSFSPSRILRTADTATQMTDINNQKIINDTLRHNNITTKEDKHANAEDDNTLEKKTKEIIINLGTFEDHNNDEGKGKSRKHTNHKNIHKKSANDKDTRFRNEEFVSHMRWEEPEDEYRYKEKYDPGLVIPLSTWEDCQHGLPFMADKPRAARRRKPKSTCKKLCRIFFKGKKSPLKEQLLRQKLDLLEIKTILNEINHGMLREEELELQHNIHQEKNYHRNNEDDSDEDIQFSLSRIKGSKKCVTFKTPLTE